MGCLLVMKLSEIILLIIICVFELMEEVGFFKGIINFILGVGFEVGDVMLGYKEVDFVLFIGGIEIGKYIMKNVVNNVMNIVLEFGGKNLNIIFDDVDFELVVD